MEYYNSTDKLIGLELAKLAKSIGFNGLTTTCYRYNDSEEEYVVIEGDGYNYYNNQIDDEPSFIADISTPTQSLLAKWLREVHKIYVSASYDHIRNDSTFLLWIFDKNKNKNNMIEEFNSYEEALEEGLYQGLLMIKQNNYGR